MREKGKRERGGQTEGKTDRVTELERKRGKNYVDRRKKKSK